MSKLKVFPVDLLGTAPSNKVVGEVRTIQRNEDRIFIPTGGPFFTKSLKVWAGTTLLTVKKDYQAMDLNRDATIDSGKEVCNAIQLKHSATTFTLEYQVIGGEYTDMAEELASFIKGTPINDLTKLDYSKVLYKPLVFPPSAHNHVATDWIGYGESIALLDQVKGAANVGRTKIFDAVKELAKKRIEEYVQSYIDKNGVVVTDKNPTLNGNILLVGNGKEGSPLDLDHEALVRELDERYFRNVINPLTRIGAISDSFLPLSTGFFNVTTPNLTNRWSYGAGYVEKNGNLVCLLPATDGEVIRYVYGYVREWSKLKSLNGYKATNQQYRPPGLADNEEIMEIVSSNDQCMLASIFTIAATGAASFKEHCIIELNGTLIQDSHVITRLGTRLLNLIGVGNADNFRSFQTQVVRMRDRKFYFVSLTKDAPHGTLSSFKYDPVTDLISKVSNWTGKKETTKLRYNPNGVEDTYLSKATEVIKSAQDDIRPVAWFKSHVVDDEDWIIDEIAPDAGYNYYLENYGINLMVSLKGDEILVHWSSHWIYTFTGPTGWLANVRTPLGRSLSIRPDKQEYTWLRTMCEGYPDTRYYFNQERGHVKQLANKNQFEFKVPLDCASSIHVPHAFGSVSNMSLQDGEMVYWSPPSRIGEPHYLAKSGYGVNDFTPQQLYNSYYIGRAYRDAPRRTSEVIYSDKLNLENPSPIPLGVAAYPMNDGLVLLQEGSVAYTGGQTWTSYYAYRPSTRLVSYKTMDAGVFSGYDTSDDRVLIAKDVPTRSWVATRMPDGKCKYSSMVFQGNMGTTNPPMEQTVYQDVTLDYAGRRFVESNPFKITAAGQEAVLFALRSMVGTDVHNYFRTWTLIISPLQPDVAMFQAEWASLDQITITRLVCAAKINWNANRELVSIVIRPNEGEMSSWRPTATYLWDITRFRLGGATAIEYNANLTEAHWHAKNWTSMGVASTNTTGDSSVASYKLSFDADKFPRLTRYAKSAGQDGYKLIVTTPIHTALMSDDVGFGVYRVAKPFLNWDWREGSAWTLDASKFFAWYTPRPTVSFKLRVMEDIEVQLGGVHSKIPRGTYELTDPLLSTVTNPKNKVILIYATLIRGVAALQFEEYPLPESIYTTYLGKCVTDEYGVTDADILPISRIGNYRASVTPRGAAFSVSSGTATEKLLLNWDADVPTDGVVVVVTARINGMDKVSQNQQTTLTCTLTPTDTEITSLKWESLDNTLATVTQSGVVTALKPGRVTIRCTVNGSIVASKGIEIEEVKLITINIADGVGSQPEGSWKVLNPVFLLDKFQEVSGRAPRANEEVRFTVPATYAVTALHTTTPAITVGNWPDNVDLTLVVEGAVLGRGGQGTKVGRKRVVTTPVIQSATAGGPAIVGGNTMLKIINRGTIAGGGGGGGGGDWQQSGGGGGGAPYGLAGSGHYDWKSGGECKPGSFLAGGAGGRMGEGRNGGYGGSWGESGRYADAGGKNIRPGKAGTALVGANFIVTNEGAGVVKGG